MSYNNLAGSKSDVARAFYDGHYWIEERLGGKSYKVSHNSHQHRHHFPLDGRSHARARATQIPFLFFLPVVTQLRIILTPSIFGGAALLGAFLTRG